MLRDERIHKLYSTISKDKITHLAVAPFNPDSWSTCKFTNDTISCGLSRPDVEYDKKEVVELNDEPLFDTLNTTEDKARQQIRFLVSMILQYNEYGDSHMIKEEILRLKDEIRDICTQYKLDLPRIKNIADVTAIEYYNDADIV